MTLGLEYGPDVEQYKSSYNGRSLVGYADSNYTNDNKNRLLTMDYVYYLNGAAVFWSSKRAKIVAVSSTKAEYIELINTSK